MTTSVQHSTSSGSPVHSPSFSWPSIGVAAAVCGLAILAFKYLSPKKFPQEGVDFLRVKNILPLEDFNTLANKVKYVPAIETIKEDETDGNRKQFLFSVELATTFQKLAFSPSYELKDKNEIHKKTNDNFINNVCIKLLNKFANELKLSGTHSFRINFMRLLPRPDTAASQAWHIDTDSRYTMVMELHNDFSREKGIGLDMYHKDCEKPHENFLSINYPVNGAIIFDNRKVVHRMSTLAPKDFTLHSNRNSLLSQACTRTIVQLVLKDENQSNKI